MNMPRRGFLAGLMALVALPFVRKSEAALSGITCETNQKSLNYVLYNGVMIGLIKTHSYSRSWITESVTNYPLTNTFDLEIQGIVTCEGEPFDVPVSEKLMSPGHPISIYMSDQTETYIKCTPIEASVMQYHGTKIVRLKISGSNITYQTSQSNQ